jgi:hypothetical protein
VRHEAGKDEFLPLRFLDELMQLGTREGVWQRLDDDVFPRDRR